MRYLHPLLRDRFRFLFQLVEQPPDLADLSGVLFLLQLKRIQPLLQALYVMGVIHPGKIGN